MSFDVRALQSHELAAGWEGREALVDGGLTVADEVLRALSGVHVVRGVVVSWVWTYGGDAGGGARVRPRGELRG